MSDRYIANGDRFDRFGFETPFADENRTLAEPYARVDSEAGKAEWLGDEFGLESREPSGAVWNFENEIVADPPRLAAMLALPGRFDDPHRNPAVEKDGTRFDAFLRGFGRAEFAAKWLAGRPALARSASEPQGDLKADDIAKAWFVIHDVGVKASLKDDRFTAKNTKKTSVHGFVNRSGNYAATYDFGINKSGTIYEFVSRKGKAIAGGKTVNIETVPDIQVVAMKPDGTPAAPSRPEIYASIGFRRHVPSRGKATYYKWTTDAFGVLADLYILASARAGHLLTITAHKEMDRNLARSVLWREYSASAIANPATTYLRAARDRPSDYHGDPFAFDFQALYNAITAKLNALGGLQMPAGARYGIHPLRVRTPTGADIGNGDGQKHEFPHQSDPVVKIDGKLKKSGWWNAGSSGETWDESPWSQTELSAISSAEADASEGLSTDTEHASPSPCGSHELEESVVGELKEEEQMTWLEPERENARACPNCGSLEGWPGETWTDRENDFEADNLEASEGFAGFANVSDATELMFEEGGYEADFETGQASGSSSYALLRLIPDDADYQRLIPLDYRLDAKAIVGKLPSDLEKLKDPSGKDFKNFAKQVFKFVSGGNPVGVMLNLLGGALKNIPGGYLAAAEKIANDWSASGFSRGVVLGAARRSNSYLIDMFGHDYIPPNDAFPHGRKIAAANYGGGLLAGYIQGRALSEKQRVIFWRDLGRRMGDQSWRGPTSTWSHKQWQDWYVDVAAAFKRYHL